MKDMAVTPSMVYELLGQSLYICNSIELRIKFLLSNSGCGIIVYGSPEELHLRLQQNWEKKEKLCKQPLGNTWKEVLELIYKVPSDKEFDKIAEKASEEGKLVHWDHIHIAGKGLLARTQKRMSAVIEHRNYLAHNFAQDYKLDDPSSCLKAYDFLKSNLPLLQKALSSFEHDCEACQTVVGIRIL